MTDSRPDEKGNQQGPGAQIMRILSGARREWPILLIFLLAAASVWIFIELAGKVVANDTPAIDHQLLELFRDPEDPTRPIGSPWFREMMRDFTGLGGTGVLTLITLSAVGFFLLERKDSAAALLAVAVLGGVVLNNVLKIGFGRPRPDLAAYEPFLSSASFPSGHSTMAAVVYLTIGALIARLHPDLAQQSVRLHRLFIPRDKQPELALPFRLQPRHDLHRIAIAEHAWAEETERNRAIFL